MAEVRRKRRPGGSVGTPAAEPEGDGPADRPMTPDEWQAHVTRAAALEIGTWLEARGRLHHPIASLTLGDLEAMASNAISRWIVMQTEKLQRAGWPPEDPIANFLLG